MQASLFADLAAEPIPLVEKESVRYLPLIAKTVLNTCNTWRMPNAVTVNPYRGCEFGCAYCYARYTHEFMDLAWEDFERRIFVKTNAPAILLRTLDVERLRGKHVAVGSATDPYQPAESKFGVTRRLLEVFAQVGGLSLSITTKSALVKRDIDLFRRIAERNEFRVNISVISLNRRLIKALEPKASTPSARLMAMKSIAKAGVKTGLLIMPIIPGLTDSERMLESLVRAAGEHGAAYVHTRALFLKKSAKKSFFRFLRRECPRLFRRYARLYGRNVYTTDEYQRALRAQVLDFKRKYGIGDDRSEFEEGRIVEPEALLFPRGGNARKGLASQRCEL